VLLGVLLDPDQGRSGITAQHITSGAFWYPKGILQKSKKAVLKVYSQRTNFLKQYES
jgi:hypothetical protein